MMESYLKKWSALASHYIGDQFDYCKPFLSLDYKGMEPFVRFVSSQLYLSCHFSSQSSLILLREGLEWDAEIILRSISEGVIKYVYMLQGSDDEILEKAKEYWFVLPEYASIKRSDKASSFLTAANGYCVPKWKAMEDLILDQQDIESIRHGSNKKSRSLLEQKWSFSEILNCFSKSEDKMLSDLVHLSYNFGMSSHLIHKDADGVGMIWERDTREPDRRKVVKLAHIARAISDICVLSDIRTIFLMKHCGGDMAFINDMKSSYHELFEEIELAGNNFYEVEYGE
ncbi:hypothetical protein GL272_08895 [Aeromonas veronii]|nr:hypothetical protein [Aeromonas veronii]